MLGVTQVASADEIKRAFRREIAKYHPDKVQHLGQEFRALAASKAADLTAANRTLSNPDRRAEYDAELNEAAGATAQRAPAPPPAPPEAAPRTREARRPAEQDGAPSPGPSVPSPGRSSDRAGAGDLVRRAAVMRFRAAADQEFGRREDGPARGFDVALQPPKAAFFSRTRPPRILGRVVASVDAATLRETWALAVRAKTDEQRDLCVFLMGPVLAPVEELGRAMSEQRRTAPSPGTLTLVPVNTSSWSAHVPNDAPPVARALLSRLKSG
jgi:hypothetical protein